MTPSRKPAETADDGAGVLAATTDIDTAGLGILPTNTEQVSVVLPAQDDDDLLDDEIVADELDVDDDDEVEAELVETGGFAAIIDDDEASDDDAIDAELDDAEDAADDDEVDDDDMDGADAEYADEEAAAVASDADDEPFEDEYDDEDDEDDLPYEIVPDPAPRSSGDEFDALIAAAVERTSPTASVRAARTAADLVPDLLATPTPSVAPAASDPAASSATGDAAPAASAPAAVAPVTGPQDTRWARAHPDDPQHADRAHAVERVSTHQEVSLTSRRIGEFEPHRESSDLLTADRMLDPQRAPQPEPEGAWQHLVYTLSGRRINLGDSRRARARKALDRRIASPLPGGAKFVPVLSRKGGVGKTTVTTLVGMALADARDDRVIAIDANPDRGTLADRFARSSGRTVRDLVRRRGQIADYHELSSIVARDDTRLDVLASDADPRVSEAFSDRDYHDVASIAAHYYSIVVTDTGTGVVHSVMGATLDLADQIVIVAGLSLDEARLASETLTWLETNGYAEQVRNAVVVLNNSRPGSPLVRRGELESHFRTRVRAVVHLPYDPMIAAGSAITFRDLQTATRDAAREVAAEVVAGLKQVAPAA